MKAPALVLLCAGTATRYNYLGTCVSTQRYIADGAVLRLSGNQIKGFEPSERELSKLFKSGNRYFVKNDNGTLRIYDSWKIKNLAEVGPNGEKFIEYSLKQFKDCGGSYAVIVVRPETEPYFADVFGKDGANFNGITIRYAHQTIPKGRRKPKGTVDATLCAAQYVKDKNVIVCNGDDIYNNVFYLLFNNAPKAGELVLPGYLMRYCVPRDNEDGVTRALLICDDQDKLVECPELEKIVWLDNKTLIDLKTKAAVKPDGFCSMNIFSFSPEVFAAMQEMDQKTPYDNNDVMEARFRGRTEFVLSHFLHELVRDERFSCEIIPFDGTTYGLTKRSDIGMVAQKLLVDYHDNDGSKPLWK